MDYKSNLRAYLAKVKGEMQLWHDDISEILDI